MLPCDFFSNRQYMYYQFSEVPMSQLIDLEALLAVLPPEDGPTAFVPLDLGGLDVNAWALRGLDQYVDVAHNAGVGTATMSRDLRARLYLMMFAMTDETIMDLEGMGAQSPVMSVVRRLVPPDHHGLPRLQQAMNPMQQMSWYIPAQLSRTFEDLYVHYRLRGTRRCL